MRARDLESVEANLQGRRLLIVDEYPITRTVLEIVFGMRGHVCMGVGSADEALACIETFEPDVVILEWHFRNGSGRGLGSRLRARALACGRSLVVVVVSVTDEPPEFRSHDSVDEYLTKPAPAAAIESAFEHHLRKQPT